MKSVIQRRQCAHDSQRYLFSLYLINSAEDIVVFLSKTTIFDHFYTFPCTFVESLQLKQISFKNRKDWYLLKLVKTKLSKVPLWIGHCQLCIGGQLTVPINFKIDKPATILTFGLEANERFLRFFPQKLIREVFFI